MRLGRVALNMQMVVNLDHPRVEKDIRDAKRLIIDAVRYWAKQNDKDIEDAIFVDDKGDFNFDTRCFRGDDEGLDEED